jgi:DNA-binding winged helix-turn-helix (wHTH) protein
MDMEQPAEAFVFGRFCLIPNRRALLADGRDVALSDRPFEILLALLMRRDRVVPKDEILQSVWAGRVVEEGNLTVHIAHLRKLLGSGIQDCRGGDTCQSGSSGVGDEPRATQG